MNPNRSNQLDGNSTIARVYFIRIQNWNGKIAVNFVESKRFLLKFSWIEINSIFHNSRIQFLVANELFA